jgi:hypothetical protein
MIRRFSTSKLQLKLRNLHLTVRLIVALQTSKELSQLVGAKPQAPEQFR